MTNYEATRPNLEQQIVVYKNGIIGSVPFDLVEDFAAGLGMKFLSSLHIQYSEYNRRLLKGLVPRQAGRIDTPHIKGIIERETRTFLKQDHDVAIDAFYNSSETRSPLRRVAKAAGAATVALKIDTPRDIARGRLIQWLDEGKWPVALQKYSKTHPRKILHNMKGMPYIAAQPGEADYIIPVDGSGSSIDIINQIEEQFIHHGLIEDDE